jgi:hypothetical protein
LVDEIKLSTLLGPDGKVVDILRIDNLQDFKGVDFSMPYLMGEALKLLPSLAA